MTAFYVFRAMFLTFFGQYRGHAHPHESPPVMTLPLAVLAVLSLAGGYFFDVPHYLEEFFPKMAEHHDVTLMAISTGAGLLGILLAYVMYVAKPGMADSLAGSMRGLHALVYNKYFVDELYDVAVVKPTVAGSRVVLWKGMDAGLIDGMVNGAGTVAKKIGGALRLMQSGNVRSYATWVLAGCVAVIVALGIAGGIR
jgi:NADH-quinone oxidoreductase subunit L